MLNNRTLFFILYFLTNILFFVPYGFATLNTQNSQDNQPQPLNILSQKLNTINKAEELESYIKNELTLSLKLEYPKDIISFEPSLFELLRFELRKRNISLPLEKKEIKLLQILKDKPSKVGFTLQIQTHFISLEIPFVAKRTCLMSKKRFYPGHRIENIMNKDDFEQAIINEADPIYFTQRGSYDLKDLSKYPWEMTRSIFPGQCLSTSLIKRAPDVKKGEWVELHLNTPQITLKLPAMALTNGLINEYIKVFVQKTKKEFQGKLLSRNIVEAQL